MCITCLFVSTCCLLRHFLSLFIGTCCQYVVLLVTCRQKALEDALLQSGQFKEALQALLEWLYKVEPQLTDNQLVHGDYDTVAGLLEKHKV